MLARSNEEKNLGLVQAAANGNTEQVAQYLRQGIPVDSDCDFQWRANQISPIFKAVRPTALMVAAARGHISVVKLLLEAGADTQDGCYTIAWSFNSSASVLCAPLVLAASEGQLATVRLLLEAKANIHGGNEAALRFAAINGHYEVVEHLLAQGADPNNCTPKKYFGYTVLMEVAHFGVQSPEVARVMDLLLQKCDAVTINATTENGWTALMYARDPRMVESLLKKGAIVDAYTTAEMACGMSVDRHTALTLAVNAGNQEKVELLLQHKANPNLVNGHDKSPLDIAIENNHFHLVETLVSYGAARITKSNRNALFNGLSTRRQEVGESVSPYLGSTGQPGLTRLVLAYLNFYAPPQKKAEEKKRTHEQDVTEKQEKKRNY